MTAASKSHVFSTRHQNALWSLMIVMIATNFCIFTSLLQRESDMNANQGVILLPKSESKRRMLLEKESALESMDFGGSSSFSSCLFVRDTDLLPEWLAYHFFTLNLRYVVIFLPDQVVTEATYELFQKWKPLMRVVDWNGKGREGLNALARLENEDERKFRARKEAAFYHNCAIHMQNNNRGMVSFHQTNEFSAINQDAVSNAKALITELGSVLRLLQYAGQENYSDSTCVSTYISHFTSVGSRVEDVQSDMPDFLHERDFVTLRWRHQQQTQTYRMGKAFVNVSAISDIPTLGDPNGLPYTFTPYCPRALRRRHAIIRMHIYPRRTDKIHIQPSSVTIVQNVVNTEVTPWLKAFVGHVGSVNAESLLTSIVPASISTARK